MNNDSDANASHMFEPTKSGNLAFIDFLTHQISSINEELNSDPELSGLTNRQLKYFPNHIGDFEYRCKLRRHLLLREKLAASYTTLKLIQSFVDEADEAITTESGIEPSLAPDSSSTTLRENATLTDVVGDDPVHVSTGPPKVVNIGQSEISTMSEFLSRPVIIYKNSLVLNNTYNITIDAWSNYMTTPSVMAKLRNFAYLSAKLKVRISVAGTPFHYGRLLAAYIPYALYNTNYTQHQANLTTNVNWQNMWNAYLSQMDGATTIDPKENKPVELTIPLLLPKPMGRLYNFNSLAITNFDDFNSLGYLCINTLNPIKATTAAGSAYITIYGWLEDIKLGTTTGTVISIATESGDEFEKGPVESVASSVEEITDYLGVVPHIGPYARAASMAAGSMARLAALFGWSRPSLASQTVRVKNQPYSSASATIGGDTTMKLTLDPKQELSIDPAEVGGSGDDQMSLAYICKRPSYFYTFAWNPVTAPVTSSLATIPISPMLSATYKYTTYIFQQPTAMGLAASPFVYWRGDITLRFEVVCSAFHRGKLGVYFDPNVSQVSLITANESLNKQYIKIVDIQQTQVFEVVVKWASHRPWNFIPSPTVDANLVTSNQQDVWNGMVIVTPITYLQSPDNSPISINVYAYSDSMAFNQLSTTNIPSYRAIPTQSGEDSPTSGVTPSAECPKWVLNESSADFDGISSHHFGEMPLSFRSLLRRYVNVYTNNGVPTTSAGTVCVEHSIYPQVYPTYGTFYAGGSTLWHTMYLSYLGMKGGIKYRYRYLGPYTSNALSHAAVTLLPPSTTSTWPPSSFQQALGVFPECSIVGSQIFGVATNQGVEIEAPCYTANSWLLCCSSSTLTPNSAFSQSTSTLTRNLRMAITSEINATKIYTAIDAAAADDFSFLRFLGAPYFSNQA